MPVNRKTQFNALYVLIAVMGVLLLQDWRIRAQAVANLPYSKFQELNAEVLDVHVEPRDAFTMIRLKKAVVAVPRAPDALDEIKAGGAEVAGPDAPLLEERAFVACQVQDALGIQSIGALTAAGRADLRLREEVEYAPCHRMIDNVIVHQDALEAAHSCVPRTMSRSS